MTCHPGTFGLRGSVPANDDVLLAERLLQSQVLRNYVAAFAEATGMPLEFRPVGKKRPGARGSKNVNPFCMQVTETDPGCRMCVDMQDKLTPGRDHGTLTANCRAGLTDSAVPVRLGERTIGFLLTGQVALRELRHEDFEKMEEWLKNAGVRTNWAALERSYFQTRVLGEGQYQGVLRLLEVFAQHLSLAAEQIITQHTHSEPALVHKAREYIQAHYGDNVSLTDVARAVNTSTFHFCKIFKRATGLTYTEYLSLVRVGRAKQLLANPQMRISEVAFDAGFNSITHFNRTFRKTTGLSPTAFREQLLDMAA